MTAPDHKAPDYTQAFRGWKGCVADREGRLFSPARRVEWPAGEPLVAECDLAASHVPPHPRCSCGIYAASTLEALRAAGYNWSDHDHDEQWVIVEVNLWGELLLRPRLPLGSRERGPSEVRHPDAVYRPLHRKEDMMDIGTEEAETITVEPIDDPVETPDPAPAPAREAEPVPADAVHP
jgi:hypothetical protein